MMLLTAILEMAGLSILYPLILALEGQGHIQQLSSIVKHQILVLFFLVALLYVGKNIILYFTYENNINFAMYYFKNLIRGLYSAYVNKSVLEFRKESAGSFANVICVQAGKLVDGVIRPLLVIITEIFILLSISALLFFINPLLMVIIVLMCGATAGLFYMLFRHKALNWGKKRMQSAATLQELVSNTSIGIIEIKLFSKEPYLTSKIYEAADVETKMFHHFEMYQQAPRYIIEATFIVTLISFFSISLIFGNAPSVLLAQFSVIAAAAFRILPSINRIVNSYSNFSFNIGPALSLLNTILNDNWLSKEKVNNINDGESQKLNVSVVELRNLAFKYPGANKPVLEGINMIIKKGQRIGIMGGSGSGKSTLIEILAGLYMPLVGIVAVDDQPITEILKPWQKNIGYVPQESFIMPGTIRENIAFSENQSFTDADLWKILQKVGLESFVSSLPNGIDTEIGMGGMKLSGGQKQLICLARALFRNPKILLLDEPTASLDVKSEHVILQAISNLSSDTIVIMVSHKRQNFDGFDLVYVCEHGKLSSLQQSEKEAKGLDKISIQ